MSLKAGCLPRNRNAFTLIELMLTMALIAMLSSLFIWNIQSLLQQGELEALQNELWSAVEKAKQSAVSNRVPHRVRFDPENQAFMVSADGQEVPFKVDTSTGEGVEIEVIADAASRWLSIDSKELVTHKETNHHLLP